MLICTIIAQQAIVNINVVNMNCLDVIGMLVQEILVGFLIVV